MAALTDQRGGERRRALRRGALLAGLEKHPLASGGMRMSRSDILSRTEWR
jgi:hypothetical protein